MFTMEFDASKLTFTIEGMDRRLRDMRPVWGEIHSIFIAFMRQQFKSEGTYAGDRWRPLNPQYAAYKMRRYGRQRILHASGRLEESFTSANARDHVYRNGPSFMEAGSRVEYAKAHQYGYPARNLPARPMIAKFTRAEGERVADVVLAYILRGR